MGFSLGVYGWIDGLWNHHLYTRVSIYELNHVVLYNICRICGDVVSRKVYHRRYHLPRL